MVKVTLRSVAGIMQIINDYFVMAFPAAIGRELGLVVCSKIKDMDNLQIFKICIQNCLPPSRGRNHTHISLSTLDTSIHFITSVR